MKTSSSVIAESALQGGLVMAKSERLELRYNIYGYRSTTAKYLTAKKSKSAKQTQNKGCYVV